MNESNITRTKALEWWNNLPDFSAPDAYCGKHGLCVKYHNSRRFQSLTGREIENIWKREAFLKPTKTVTGDILDSQDFYEVMQQYRHAPTTDQERVVKAFNEVKNWIRENLLNEQNELNKVVSETIPEWLTPYVRKAVKETWDSHKTCDDGLRIKAMKLVQEAARKEGYEIGIKKSMELMTKFCNIYD